MDIFVKLLILTYSNLLSTVGTPVVQLQFGKLVGETTVRQDTPVHTFLGIPFAKPPVEELRFKKPLPWTENWANNRSATSHAKSCVQPKEKADLSEDCLYLNVWTTVDPQSSTDAIKPVMVYIHGGGFQLGSPNDPIWDGANLSAAVDAVIVTIAYRLGPLGFAYGGDENMPANVAMYDQAMALQWVQDNIAAFGGDPSLVTIAGQSAGGMSVSIHLVSPVSFKLFKQAISMGGVADTSTMLLSKQDAVKKTRALAEIVGCKQEDEGPISSETLDCLRGVSAETLVAGQYHQDVLKQSLHGSYAFPPMFGDEFLPDEPEILAKAGKHNNGSKLFGTVSYEGSTVELFIQFYVQHIKQKDYSSSKEYFLEQMRTVFKYLGEEFTSIQNDALKMYFDDVPDAREPAYAAFYEILGDMFIQCPVMSFAGLLSKTTSVYQYVVSHEIEQTFCPGLSPCHADEVGVMFANTLKNDADNLVWQEMVNVLREFLRNGRTPWTPYFWTHTGLLIPPFYDFKSIKRTGPRQYQYRPLPCSFWMPVWQRYLNALRSASQSRTSETEFQTFY